MFSILLAVCLLSEISCGPLPNAEFLPDEGLGEVEPSLDAASNTPQGINPTAEVGSGSVGEEKLEARETFYPTGGVWWGIRPWGGWGGWGGYRPWHGPPWGGHWGGHWGGGRWGRTSS